MASISSSNFCEDNSHFYLLVVAEVAHGGMVGWPEGHPGGNG
jgi:hypothetical protein